MVLARTGGTTRVDLVQTPLVFEGRAAAAAAAALASGGRGGCGAGPASPTCEASVVKSDPGGRSRVLEADVSVVSSLGERSAPAAGARVRRLGPMKLKFTLPGGGGVEEEKKRIAEVLEKEGSGGAVSGDPKEAEDGGALGALVGEVELGGGQEEEEEHEDREEREEVEQEQEEQEIVEEDGPARASDAAMCFLCGKSFPSRKSLYGHMRCHPEREWRGINPPPGARIRGAPPTGSSQKDANSMNAGPPSNAPAASPLCSWSTTQKRGRKGTKHHSPVRSVCFLWNEDPMANAVCSLLDIAEGGRNNRDLVEPRMPTDVSVDEGEVISDDGLSSNPGDADLELGTVETLEDVDQLEASNGDINGDSEEQDRDASEKKRKRKIKELETLQESKLAGRNRYRCTTCNQCFPNHQALGGHRARSHKKEKRAPEEESAGDDGQAASPPPNMEPPPATLHVVVPKAPALAEHRCDKCSMVFPTGQALGGHKRKHWNGHESSAAAALPPNKESAQRLPPPGSGSSSSGQPREIMVLQRCLPGHGDPSAGMPIPVKLRQRFPEVEASATPIFEEIEKRRHDLDPEKASGGAPAEDENGQRQGSGTNQVAAASATKVSAQMALGKMHDFDLNERPQDGQEE